VAPFANPWLTFHIYRVGGDDPDARGGLAVRPGGTDAALG